MYMYTCIYGFAFYRFTCSCFIYLSPVEKEKQAFIHDYNMIQRIATSGRWTEGMHWLTHYVTFNHPNCWGCFSINSNGFMRSGVVIVQDYIGMPQQPGNQVVHADEASWMAEVMKSESVLEPSIFGGEGEAVRPCNFHRKHYFPESPLKASMSKINLHIIIKQFCITVVSLGNDVYSLLKKQYSFQKMEGVFLTN